MAYGDSKLTTTLRELTRPSSRRWLFGVACNWALVASIMATAIYLDHWLSYLICMWLIGPVQHRIALMGHDGAHGTAARSRWLNDTLTSLLAFWPLGLGLFGYRKFHFLHHHTVGSRQDPELKHKNAVDDWKVPTSPQKLVKMTAMDLFGLSAKQLGGLIKLSSPKHWLDVVGPMTMIGTFWALVVFTGRYEIPALWYGALVTTFWCVFRWRIFSEHVGVSNEAYTHRILGSWWQRLLFLSHNTDHHWEHHRWPSIPYWNLPRARKLVKAPKVLSFSEALAAMNDRAEHRTSLPKRA